MWIDLLVGFLLSALTVAVLDELTENDPLPSNAYGLIVIGVTVAYVLLRRARRNAARESATETDRDEQAAS